MGSDGARRLLARLAGDEPTETPPSSPPTVTDYGRIIEEASAALDDLDAAAEFVDDGGLERLEAAVERAEGDLSERAEKGRKALDAYRDFRAAARGSDESLSSTLVGRP